MDELKWNWIYIPYLDAPEVQAESALKAGYAKVYFKSEVDAIIAKLKDKCQMHDFFWEGCGFEKRGFKNAIAVREAFDKLEAENERLRGESCKLTDGCLRLKQCRKEKANVADELRDTRRALWLERAERAKEKAFNWRFRNPNNNNCLYGINCLVEYDERKIRRTNNEWFEVFSEVERKCRAKAEEYK